MALPLIRFGYRPIQDLNLRSNSLILLDSRIGRNSSKYKKSQLTQRVSWPDWVREGAPIKRVEQLFLLLQKVEQCALPEA